MQKFLRAVLIATLSSSLAVQIAAAAPPADGDGGDKGNILTVAVAYKQTAAEYRALYYQAFNVARMQLDKAIAAHHPDDKPLAVVTDVDDTIVLHSDYWGTLVESGRDFFDDDIWDEHIRYDTLTATPGALEFLNYCREKGVEVFYVTGRNQGEGTYELALKNLQEQNFPYADKEHLTVLMDTSNKEAVQEKIAADYNIVLLIGDNLNDFKRIFYVKDVFERKSLVDEDRDLFGTRFIVLPNPTDGHWVRAIFGESEPPANEANRETWRRAATSEQSPAFRK